MWADSAPGQVGASTTLKTPATGLTTASANPCDLNLAVINSNQGNVPLSPAEFTAIFEDPVVANADIVYSCEQEHPVYHPGYLNAFAHVLGKPIAFVPNLITGGWATNAFQKLDRARGRVMGDKTNTIAKTLAKEKPGWTRVPGAKARIWGHTKWTSRRSRRTWRATPPSKTSQLSSHRSRRSKSVRPTTTTRRACT